MSVFDPYVWCHRQTGLLRERWVKHVHAPSTHRDSVFPYKCSLTIIPRVSMGTSVGGTTVDSISPEKPNVHYQNVNVTESVFPLH